MSESNKGIWFVPSKILDQTDMQPAVRIAHLPTITLEEFNAVMGDNPPEVLRSTPTKPKRTKDPKEPEEPEEPPHFLDDPDTYGFLEEIRTKMLLRDKKLGLLKTLIKYIYTEGYAGIVFLLNKTIRPSLRNDFLLTYASMCPRLRNRKVRKVRPVKNTFISMDSSAWDTFYKAGLLALRQRVREQVDLLSPNQEQSLKPKLFSAQPIGESSNTYKPIIWGFNKFRENPIRVPEENILFSGYGLVANNRFIDCLMGLPIGWTSPFHKVVWSVSIYKKDRTFDTRLADYSAPAINIWTTPTVSSIYKSSDKYEAAQEERLKKKGSKSQTSTQVQMGQSIRWKR